MSGEERSLQGHGVWNGQAVKLSGEAEREQRRRDVFQGFWVLFFFSLSVAFPPPSHVELWIALVAFIRLWPSTSRLPRVSLSKAGAVREMFQECWTRLQRCDRHLGLCKLNTVNSFFASCGKLILGSVSRCVSMNLETAQIEITYWKHAKWKHVNLKKKTTHIPVLGYFAWFFKKKKACFAKLQWKGQIIDLSIGTRRSLGNGAGCATRVERIIWEFWIDSLAVKSQTVTSQKSLLHAWSHVTGHVLCCRWLGTTTASTVVVTESDLLKCMYLATWYVASLKWPWKVIGQIPCLSHVKQTN